MRQTPREGFDLVHREADVMAGFPMEIVTSVDRFSYSPTWIACVLRVLLGIDTVIVA